jgi:hypothetical protein
MGTFQKPSEHGRAHIAVPKKPLDCTDVVAIRSMSLVVTSLCAERRRLHAVVRPLKPSGDNNAMTSSRSSFELNGRAA